MITSLFENKTHQCNDDDDGDDEAAAAAVAAADDDNDDDPPSKNTPSPSPTTDPKLYYHHHSQSIDDDCDEMPCGFCGWICVECCCCCFKGCSEWWLCKTCEEDICPCCCLSEAERAEKDKREALDKCQYRRGSTVRCTKPKKGKKGWCPQCYPPEITYQYGSIFATTMGPAPANSTVLKVVQPYEETYAQSLTQPVSRSNDDGGSNKNDDQNNNNDGPIIIVADEEQEQQHAQYQRPPPPPAEFGDSSDLNNHNNNDHHGGSLG